MKRETPSFHNWIPKAQAAKMTGKGMRTLERFAQQGKIRQAYVEVSGRRPLPVFHPEDVAKFVAKKVEAIPVAAEAQVPAVRPRASLPAVSQQRREVAEPAAEQLSELVHKLNYTILEAVRVSGLPASYLRRQIHAGALPARKIGGWRIRREDLAALGHLATGSRHNAPGEEETSPSVRPRERAAGLSSARGRDRHPPAGGATAGVAPLPRLQLNAAFS
jgi:hypothetical protein